MRSNRMWTRVHRHDITGAPPRSPGPLGGRVTGKNSVAFPGGAIEAPRLGEGLPVGERCGPLSTNQRGFADVFSVVSDAAVGPDATARP